MARVLIAGANVSTGACFRWTETNDKLVQFQLFQSTLINCDFVLDGSNTAYGGAIGATSLKRIKWSILDGGAGITRMINLNYGGMIEAGTWDATDNILHERSSAIANWGRYLRPTGTSNASVNLTAWRSDVDGESEVIDPAMDGAFVVASNIANSTLQVGDADANTSPACQVGKECKSPPANQTYTVPLYAPIWKEALSGATTDLANLTLSVSQYGAR